MKNKPVKPDDLSPIETVVYDFITQPPPLTDAFGFQVTKRTRTRAAQEGYDVVVVRGVAYYVDTQDHLAICE